MPGVRQDRSRSPDRRRDRTVDSRPERAGPSSHRRHRGRPRSRSRARRSPSPSRNGQVQKQPRSRSRSRSRERGKGRPRSWSRSRSKERSEKRKRARTPSSSTGSDDSHSRRKRGKKKERKREKKRGKKEKKKAGGNSSHWGKYGIISDTDIFSKTSEFHAWLVEERKINPETISKELQRKEFSRFIEDFNTATLPNDKYYNMEAYERRMNALRQGEYLPPAEDIYDYEADLKAIKSAHKKKVEEPETYLSREQLLELRKVQQERVEISRMKLLGMDIKQSHGVRMDGSAFDE